MRGPIQLPPLEALELEFDGALFHFSHLPRIYQAFLMSATFNEDVQALKELVLHNPVRAPWDHQVVKSCTLTLTIVFLHQPRSSKPYLPCRIKKPGLGLGGTSLHFISLGLITTEAHKGLHS